MTFTNNEFEIHHRNVMPAKITTLQFVFLAALSMTCFGCLCIATILGYKLINFGPITLSAGICTFSVAYICTDIITEAYGYEVSKYLRVAMFTCLFIFSIAIWGIIKIPSPGYWHHQHSYDDILGQAPRLALAIILSLWIGNAINSRLLAKWKLLLHGRYFWLRSLGSTAVGEAIDTTIGFTISFAGVTQIKHIFYLIVSTFIVKVLYASIFIYPANFVAFYIKHKLKIDVYDYPVRFNPFQTQPIEKNA